MMTYEKILLAINKAAKMAKVSNVLLLAICSHESSDFKMPYNPADKGSPSYGICQVKEATAKFLGFTGQTEELNEPYASAYWAAKYIGWQQKRYGVDDWCLLTAAYNAGSFIENKKHPGQPINVDYIKKVKKKLDEKWQNKLECDSNK